MRGIEVSYVLEKRSGVTCSDCTAVVAMALTPVSAVHIGNSVHCYSD
jgi:hypothetical protein